MNLALGTGVSLDVVNDDRPDGSLIILPTGPFSGQVWQFLEASDAVGHYYISSEFLGAKRKLDALPNERGDYAPHLRDFSEYYTQTWSLTPYVDALSGNRTTWTMTPDFVTTDIQGTYSVFSAYNDTFDPYLAPFASNDQYQRWLLLPDGTTIDDLTYSATHLPALATEAPIIAIEEPTVAPTAPALITSPPSAVANSASTSDDASHITGPLIAAAVVPTTVFALAVAAFVLFICMRRRKLRKLDENSPYPTPEHPRPRGDSPSVSKSTAVLTEIVDSFAEKPLYQWKREKGTDVATVRGLTSVSLMSSNLSASTRSLQGPRDSGTSVVVSPLSPPPLTRLYSIESGENTDEAVSELRSLDPKKPKEMNCVSFIEVQAPQTPDRSRRNSERSVRDKRRAMRKARLGIQVHSADSSGWI
ncbi:unnamed protein product [Discula destructiva]